MRLGPTPRFPPAAHTEHNRLRLTAMQGAGFLLFSLRNRDLLRYFTTWHSSFNI